MDSIKKLDTIVATWYEKAPHLPANGQQWLARNVWWITLVGVILGIIGVIQFFLAAFFVGILVGGLAGGVALGGLALLATIFTLGLAAICLVICAMAISPLKVMQTKGWLLLFIALLISTLSTVLALLLSWNIGSFITGLIFIAIAGYFLYEIRGHFGKVSASEQPQPPFTPQQ